MKKTKHIIPLFIAIASFAVGQTFAQGSVSMIPGQSSIVIKGSSNVHDWEEKVEKFKVNLLLKIREKEIEHIEKVQVVCESSSIRSANNIMTNKTHEALKVEKYPQIEFQLVTVDKLSSNNGSFSGTLVGDVTLAGVTKRISIAFNGIHSGSKITIKGSKDLNMMDFKIKPPTAMLGTLKTDEAITVSFHLNFQVS